MKSEEIDFYLKRFFPTRQPPIPPASEADWKSLSEFFSIHFPGVFVDFMNLIGKYHLEGDWLHVSNNGMIEGDNTIVSAVISEIAVGDWQDDLIPFYSVGNGDYYSLRKNKGDAVYYIYHEDRSVERLHESLESFIKTELSDFA